MILTSLWAVLLGSCAFWDLKWGKIPNLCTAAIGGCGLIYKFCYSRWTDCVTSCILAVTILLLGYLFGYLPGGLGAGDVKLLALAPMILQERQIPVFLMTSLIIALFMGVIKILLGKKHMIRMAVPVFLGGLLTVVQPFFLPV